MSRTGSLRRLNRLTRYSGRLAFALVAVLALAACSPKPSDPASEAAKAVAAAAAYAAPIDGVLSAAQLAEAKQGTLRGYREDATRLAIHYFTDIDAPDRRHWMKLAAETGSSRAIQGYLLGLRQGAQPGDCAEARALIASSKALYAREIAAAKAKNLRDDKNWALEDLRDQERQMSTGACANA
jgi:hypothetical protein